MSCSSLCAEDVQKACSYRVKNSGTYILPQWTSNAKNRQQYIPSHNIAPTDVTPVLVSGSHFSCESERMLQPMMWGMIPKWHKVRVLRMCSSWGTFEIQDVSFILFLRTAGLSCRKPVSAWASCGTLHTLRCDKREILY